MTSHWTRARGARFAIVRPAYAIAAVLLVVLALPVTAGETNAPAKSDTAQHPRPLVIGLTCDGSPSPVRELHHWDSRVPMGGGPEQCLDGNTKLRIVPRGVALKYNPATDSLGVVLTISEADRKAINDLFTAALMSGKRRDLILIDGKVVISRNVASVISGPSLLIGMRSDEDARAVATVLSEP